MVSFFGLFYKPESKSVDLAQNQGVQIQFIDLAEFETPSPKSSSILPEVATALPLKQMAEIPSLAPVAEVKKTKVKSEPAPEVVVKKDSVAPQSNLPTQSVIPAKFTPQVAGKFPVPLYPRWAKQQGIHGQLLLRVTVGASGAVLKVKVEESSGNNALDEFAMDWVAQRWIWPKGIENIVLVPFVFELK